MPCITASSKAEMQSPLCCLEACRLLDPQHLPVVVRQLQTIHALVHIGAMTPKTAELFCLPRSAHPRMLQVSAPPFPSLMFIDHGTEHQDPIVVLLAVAAQLSPPVGILGQTQLLEHHLVPLIHLEVAVGRLCGPLAD